MKKINIIHYKMVYGGIETSLISLVNILKQKFDVNVYTLFSGPLDERIDCKCENLLNSSAEVVFNSQIYKEKKSLKTKIKTVYLGFEYLSGIMAKKLVKKIRSADINLCFLPSRICIDITNRLKGKKYCFIHGDVDFVELSNWKIKKLKSYDKILAVSRSCKNHIEMRYPCLKDKIDFLYNTQNTEIIINNSKEEDICFSDKSKLNILSCSRLSKEKGIIRSLEVFKKLKESNYDFMWHILGDGEERENIEQYIKEKGLDKNVILYGNQSNPYPYIKQADLFYLGSYHEAAPMVYAEAMTLGVPVLTTNTCSAEELVGEKGFVCENSENGIYESIKAIFDNPQILKQKKKNLKSFSYDNNAIVQKLLSIIDN